MKEPLPSLTGFKAVPLKELVSKKQYITSSLVKVINLSNNPLPKYETDGAAGMDICANIETDPYWAKGVELEPGETRLIPTGIFVAVQPGYEIQVRPRSGLSLKTKLRVANSPGTVDSDYRGEIKVIMTNIGDHSEIINHGDRIAQLVLCPVMKCDWEEVTELPPSSRGSNGFGSTGVNKPSI